MAATKRGAQKRAKKSNAKKSTAKKAPKKAPAKKSGGGGLGPVYGKLGGVEKRLGALEGKVGKLAAHDKKQDKAIMAVAEETDKNAARLDAHDRQLDDLLSRVGDMGPAPGWKRFGGATRG